jgi:hypothetical protein
MKLVSSIIIGLSLLSATPAFAAAPAFRSTRWFDNQIVDNGKRLDVTGRVISGSIQADVERIQTQTIDGKKVPIYAAIDSNMTALSQHCDLSRRADDLSSVECHYKARVRIFPTIKSGF